MRLESSNSLWLASLSNSVHGVTDTHLGLDWLKLFVQSDQHARVDRQSQVEEEIVILASDESLHVRRCEENGQKTGEGDIREEEFVRVEWVKTEQTLAHVHKTLSDSDDKELISSRWSLIVAREESQVLCQLRVICSSADQTKSLTTNTSVYN